MKKRLVILPLLLVFLFSLFFVSCGKKDKEEEKTTAKVEQKAAEPAKKAEEKAQPAVAKDKKLKAGFVYVGPVGDYGWSHAHDQGRLFAEKNSPGLKRSL